MSHTLSLSDGTTTLSLAQTTATGYVLISFRTPRPNRQMERTSNGPAANGNRTTAAWLEDTTAEIVIDIIGSSNDDLDAKLIALDKLLDQAQRWATERIGSPVRLLFKHDGATNTSYRVITGVPLMPEPVDLPEIQWLDAASALLTMRTSFAVTLEPYAHAGAVTNLITTTLTVQPGSDQVASGVAVVGDLPGPLKVTVKNTTVGAQWESVWMALLDGAPTTFNWTNIVDATAYGGRQDFVLGTTPTTVYSATYTPTSELPIRPLLRCKVGGGLGIYVQIRAVLSIGTTTIEGRWVPFEGVTVNWSMTDLGALRLPQNFLKRAAAAGAFALLTVEARTTTGAATLGADYLEILTYRSFVKVTATMLYQYALAWEMILQDGSFYYPASSPEVYAVDSSSDIYDGGEARGELGMITPGITTRFWFSATDTTEHAWGDTGLVTLDYLPAFALGLRGAV